MRYAKRNLRIVGIGTAVILSAAVISLSSHTKSLRPVIQAEEQNGSALEAVLGNDILPNTAYDWGSVYTLNDGTDIAQKYVNEESGYTVYGGAEGYQVLGSDTGGGLVQGMGKASSPRCTAAPWQRQTRRLPSTAATYRQASASSCGMVQCW